MLHPLTIWSTIVFSGVSVALAGTQRLVSLCPLLSPHSSIINEFLFSLFWVVSTMENILITNMTSKISGLVVLGLRLLFSPIISQRVHGNPCSTLYQYLKEPAHSRKTTPLFLPICVQLLAVPLGIASSLAIWQLISPMSDYHFYFLEKKIDSFLSIPPVAGFFTEMISFLMFMPQIFLPDSKFFKVVDVFFIVYLISQFGMLTGAFMNPMAALASVLMWHSESFWFLQELWIHVTVFWFGPFIGTILAVSVANMQPRIWKYKHHLD